MKYGRLTLIRHLPQKNKQPFALFRCDCGTIKEAYFNNVKSGKSKSCGCYRNQRIKETRSNHSKDQERAYRIWNGIKGRCTVKSNGAYKNYGAKGITICDRWLESFQNFWDDMGKPKENETIDRKDSRLGYFKENCRWATYKLQARNRRRIIGSGKVKFRGVCWSKKNKKYLARITSNGKTYKLYEGKSCVTAIHKRCLAEKKHFGFVSKCY